MSIPKAITPAEASSLSRIEDEVAAVVTRLNKSISVDYGNRQLTFSCEILGSTPNVRNAALIHFRAAGWNVEFHSDQRDGDFYTFSSGSAGGGGSSFGRQ